MYKIPVFSCCNLSFFIGHVTNFLLSGYQRTKRNCFNFGDRTEHFAKSRGRGGWLFLGVDKRYFLAKLAMSETWILETGVMQGIFFNTSAYNLNLFFNFVNLSNTGFTQFTYNVN